MATPSSSGPGYGSNQLPQKLRGGQYSGEEMRRRAVSGTYRGDEGVLAGRSGSSAHGVSDRLSQENPREGEGEGNNRGGIVRERLFRAVEQSYRNLSNYRDMNRLLVKHYGGAMYENSGASKKPKYLDLLNQAVDSYQTLLAANRPRVMVSTNLSEYRAFAKHFGHAVNAMLKEIRFEETLRRWVMDAFFCVGVVKTHIADSGLVEIEPDRWMDPGTPFASNVSLDDFVYDTSAKKWSEVRYAGDMYRISFAEAEEMFGEDAMAGHTPSSKGSLSEDRLQQISRGEETDDDDLEPMIDLADIWIPRLGVIETYVVDSRDQFTLKGEPVAVEEWTGGEEGPYHILGFNDVPENIMPTSPASHLEMLETLINNLMRKSARQGQRQKDVHIYTAAGAPSANKIRRADDGEWVQVNSVDEVGLMKQGGVDQGNYAFMLGSMELFDRMAGNLKAQMGLGSQSDTVGQEKLIHGAASRKEGQMQYVMLNAATKLIRQLGMMLWQDPFKQIVMEISIPGAPGYTYTSKWEPGDREGNFLDYNFEIDVYSMQAQSPGMKVQRLNEIVSGVVLPMAQMLAQQGGMIDLFALMRTYAELLNIPELLDIVKFGGQFMDMNEQSAIADVPKSPTSTRNYVRHNTGGAGSDPLQQSLKLMGQAGGGGMVPAQSPVT